MCFSRTVRLVNHSPLNWLADLIWDRPKGVDLPPGMIPLIMLETAEPESQSIGLLERNPAIRGLGERARTKRLGFFVEMPVLARVCDPAGLSSVSLGCRARHWPLASPRRNRPSKAQSLGCISGSTTCGLRDFSTRYSGRKSHVSARYSSHHICPFIREPVSDCHLILVN